MSDWTSFIFIRHFAMVSENDILKNKKGGMPLREFYWTVKGV